MTETLPDLVRAAQCGDIEAFGQLVQRFQRMAFAVAYPIVGDMHLAEDAAQEAFIEAFTSLARLREPVAFAGWFRQIVVKRADRLVRGKQLETVSIDAVDQLASAQPEPPRVAELRELQGSVHHALGSLREQDSLLVRLFHLNGYSQHEIARLVDLPEAVVKKRLFRARRQLRHYIEETMFDAIEGHLEDHTAFARSVQFFVAVRAGAYATVERLLNTHPALVSEHERWDEAFARRNHMPAAGSATALHRAAAVGDKALATLLLARGADPNAGTKTGQTPLHMAVLNDQLALLELLLAHGADPNRATERGMTPLHWAAIRVRPSALQHLLRAGANPNAYDAEGRTAHDWALLKGYRFEINSKEQDHG